jgi:hypothetical protein
MALSRFQSFFSPAAGNASRWALRPAQYMNMEEELVFPFNRTKIVIQMLTQIALIFMCGSLFKLFFEDPTGNRVIILIISPLAIALAVSSFIFALRAFLSKSPGLVINRAGIIDNTTGASAGKIPWENIGRIFVTQQRSTQFLTIEVHNPEQYLRQGTFLSRIFKRINYTFFHSPIHISAHALDVSFSEMVESVERYHRKYGHQ